MQGGGALGAYQASVYEALAEAGLAHSSHQESQSCGTATRREQRVADRVRDSARGGNVESLSGMFVHQRGVDS